MEISGMRFSELTEREMTREQLSIYQDICSGPRGGFRGPMHMLIRSPEFAQLASRLGEYVRYRSSLVPRISELAILIAARYWTAQFEWYVHAAHAAKAGLATDVILQLAQGKRPVSMASDESAAYDFCSELHYNKSVSDKAFDSATNHFGENGVVDLMGISGYYTLISMAVNLNKQPLPYGISPPLAPLQ